MTAPVRAAGDQAADTVIFDVDGTLVDTNYHHVLAWAAAFGSVGVVAPCWQIHRAVGMGGDKLVGAVAGEQVERRHGDAVRAAWEQAFDEMIDDVVAFDDAAALVTDVAARGYKVALASSGKRRHVQRFLDIARVADLADAWTTSDDAQESKPSPDLFQAALDRVGGQRALVIGDSPYDAEAARKLGMPVVGLLCGGFSEQVLRQAGAGMVLPAVADVRARLDEVLEATAR